MSKSDYLIEVVDNLIHYLQNYREFLGGKEVEIDLMHFANLLRLVESLIRGYKKYIEENLKEGGNE